MLSKAGRVKDAVRVFETSLERVVKPDDDLCGYLLSVVALCEQGEMDAVLALLGEGKSHAGSVCRDAWRRRN